jgi:hypothetical protein
VPDGVLCRVCAAVERLRIARASRLVDRMAGPLLSDNFMWGAMRHTLIGNVLGGMPLRDRGDVLRWLGGTGINALGSSSTAPPRPQPDGKPSEGAAQRLPAG